VRLLLVLLTLDIAPAAAALAVRPPPWDPPSPPRQSPLASFALLAVPAAAVAVAAVPVATAAGAGAAYAIAAGIAGAAAGSAATGCRCSEPVRLLLLLRLRQSCACARAASSATSALLLHRRCHRCCHTPSPSGCLPACGSLAGRFHRRLRPHRSNRVLGRPCSVCRARVRVWFYVA